MKAAGGDGNDGQRGTRKVHRPRRGTWKEGAIAQLPVGVIAPSQCLAGKQRQTVPSTCSDGGDVTKLVNGGRRVPVGGGGVPELPPFVSAPGPHTPVVCCEQKTMMIAGGDCD